MALSLCNTTTDQQGRELVAHGTALFPVACYHDDLSKESVPWHWHDELEGFIVSQGTAIVAAGAQTYTVAQGEGFFINAGIVHAAWCADCAVCRFHSIVFHPRLVGSSIDSVFWQNYLQPLLESQTLKNIHLDGSDVGHAEMLAAIETAWQSGVAEAFGYEFQVRAALSQLILRVSNYHPIVTKQPSEKMLRESQRIKTMLLFVHKHFCEPLTVATIAAQASIGESECLRCFRSVIGTSPIQYLKHFRVQKAAEQLLASNDKIIAIGLQCGFQDMSYFTKSFRELKGCSPSEYRKRSTG